MGASILNLLRFPTGIAVVDEVTVFAAERLPAMFGKVPQVKRPSLAEDWWVGDRETDGFVFPVHGLRACYRWARNRNVETGRLLFLTSEQAADLLLHQFAVLIPTVVSKAAEFHTAKREPA